MKKRNYVLSVRFGTLALAAGALCHRQAPGLGLVLMPMFWPLTVLAALVPRRFSVTTAALVPFVSFLLTGMPVLPFAAALKFALFATVAAWCFRRRALKGVS